MPLPWGLRMVVCGFWGLFCFGLPGSHLCGGWVGLWSGFSGLNVLTLGSGWLFVCGWLGPGLLVLFGEFDPGS
ncbi:hypothetical protein, partial [Actinomyces sp. HMSC075C01]|uniref:hypothetical protein n=1 Tax=Actinomyces sp. HMSC075C01 TaxID=1739387 RepID=UPI001C40776A